MKTLMLSALTATAMTAALATSAMAGSSQNGGSTLPLYKVERFSNTVQTDLAQRGAHVAIVARVGRDPKDLPNGIDFTHVGLWVLSDVTKDDGTTYRGYRVWNLYQRADDPGISDLIQDGPVDFFAGAERLRAGVIVPKPALQQRLLSVLNSPAYARLHNPIYSVLANPNNNVYQNCTEHLLNVLVAALYETEDMGRIKANIQAHFDGHRIKLSPAKRTFGPLLVAGVETDDHRGQIRTTTFGSLARFLSEYDLAKAVYRIDPADAT